MVVKCMSEIYFISANIEFTFAIHNRKIISFDKIRYVLNHITIVYNIYDKIKGQFSV